MEKENVFSKPDPTLYPEHVHLGERADINLTYEQFGEILRHRLATLKGAKFFDHDLTVCNCPKEQLSPGCLACKSGAWICVFPGFTCNAACRFCPRLTAQNTENKMSERQMDFLFELIARRAHKIRGLSISGGELFHDNLQSAKKILRYVKKHHPHIYLWGYTNGIGATRDNMEELHDLGMDELRFDLAATDFRVDIIRKIRKDAVRIFPWVTVEVPAYEQTLDFMVRHGGLKELSDIGVKQINLAEIRVPFPSSGSNNVAPATRTFLGQRSLYQYRNSLGSRCLNLVESRLATWDILDHAYEQGLAITVNDCSQDAKTLQEVQRYMTGIFMIQRYANGPIEGSKQRRMTKPAYRAIDRLSAIHPRLGAVAALAIGDVYLLPFTHIGRMVQRIRKSPHFMPKSLASL